MSAWLLARGTLRRTRLLIDSSLVVALVPQLPFEVVHQSLEGLADQLEALFRDTPSLLRRRMLVGMPDEGLLPVRRPDLHRRSPRRHPQQSIVVGPARLANLKLCAVVRAGDLRVVTEGRHHRLELSEGLLVLSKGL